MILLDELQKASRREKLAIGVSALFFLSPIGIAPYIGPTLAWKTLVGGIVGLVIAYLLTGNRRGQTR